jgi:hypothetical protein
MPGFVCQKLYIRDIDSPNARTPSPEAQEPLRNHGGKLFRLLFLLTKGNFMPFMKDIDYEFLPHFAAD